MQIHEAVAPALILVAFAVAAVAVRRYRGRGVAPAGLGYSLRAVVRGFCVLLVVKALVFYVVFDGARLFTPLDVVGGLLLLAALYLWFEMRVRSVG